MQNRIKIAVLVSGGGTNLQALIDAEKSGVINNGEISLVISNNASAYALERAKNADINTAIVLKKECTDQREFEEKIEKLIFDNNIELIVLAGFMSILSVDFTSKFPRKMINIHPSLIPSFCGKGFYGLHVHEAALEYGVKLTGATTHFVNEIPDGGEIIMQRAIDILDDDTPETLQKRVMEQIEWKILPLSVEKICIEMLGD